MFGKIQLENFTGLTSMPQKAATAWGAVEKLVGVSYKPLLYLGKQTAKGENFYFIAERTLITAAPVKNIVMIVLNVFNSETEILTVEEII